MGRMFGRRVWRGQTVEDASQSRKHWRARENREWRRELVPTARDEEDGDE